MHSLETYGTVDNKGFLTLSQPLLFRNKNVKVIIYVPDNDDIDDNLWMHGLANNPAFSFLSDEKEDIYSLNDGVPFIYNEI